MTKEQIIEKGLEILESLKLTTSPHESTPIVEREVISITRKDGVYEEEGWTFEVRANHWQFGNDQGLYIITFLLDGTPHKLHDITGGRVPSLFLYKTTSGEYETYLSIEEMPD